MSNTYVIHHPAGLHDLETQVGHQNHRVLLENLLRIQAQGLQRQAQVPVKPTGKPRPAARATPGPVASAAAVVGPPDVVPSLAAGSAGGGPSTDNDMTCAPRMIVSPMARRSSVSVTCCAAPGAALPLRRVRRNSSVSARTRFIC